LNEQGENGVVGTSIGCMAVLGSSLYCIELILRALGKTEMEVKRK
jgi:hypothetical protein